MENNICVQVSKWENPSMGLYRSKALLSERNTIRNQPQKCMQIFCMSENLQKTFIPGFWKKYQDLTLL